MNLDSLRPLAGRMLPDPYFTSPELFELERQKIFGASWHCVGRREQLAEEGDFLLADVADESLIVVQSKDKQLRAHYNVCRHRGTRLCSEASGHFDRGLIQCQYHCWTYDCSGTLVAAPRMEDESGSFRREDWPLKSVAIEEWEGFLFVNLSPSPEPLRTAFASHWNRLRSWRISDLKVAHHETYDLETNWKLVFHNFNECYHCLSVHPGLNELSPVRSGTNDFTEGRFLGGPMDLSGKSMTISGECCAPPINTLAAGDEGRVYYYTLFPNLLLALHPDFVMAWRIHPQGPGNLRIECSWLFEPEAIATPGFDPGDAVEFWNRTNRQDWEVCQKSYSGITSRSYSPGPWAPNETIPQAFDREVIRSLGHEWRDVE